MSDKFTTQEIPVRAELATESQLSQRTTDNVQKHQMEINTIKASSGEERAEKITALIGEKASSSALAQHLFPELAPQTRGIATRTDGHVDMTNPSDPDYVLSPNSDLLVDKIKHDLKNGTTSAKDLVTMLQLAKDIGINNKQLLDGALAAVSMSCGKQKDGNGAIRDFGIEVAGKTDEQEINCLRQSFEALRRNSDMPDSPVKTILGDAFPPKRGTTPYANLQANIKIVDEFLLPSLRSALSE